MTAPVMLGHDPEFAARLESHGIEALANGDVVAAGYFFDASDMWDVPSEAVSTLRMVALHGAMAAAEARQR